MGHIELYINNRLYAEYSYSNKKDRTERLRIWDKVFKDETKRIFIIIKPK